MPHRPARTPLRSFRTAALAVAAVIACAVPLLSTGAASAADAARVGAANRTLVPALLAAGGTVTADGGWVAMPHDVRVSLRPASFSQCPADRICFWEDANYVGRILVLPASSGASYPDFAIYSFVDITSSWANRSTSFDARWFYNSSFGGTTRCMNPGASSSNVGATDNDKASSARVYTDGVACS